jgi:hypothetical protein
MTLDGVLDWILDLLNTLPCNSQLHLIIAPLLISTLYKSYAKSFPAWGVFTSSCLVMASNNGYSSASMLKSSLNGSSLLTVWVLAPVVLLIIPRQRPPQKPQFPTVPPRLHANCCRRNLFVCDHCLETNVVSEPFTSNGCFSGSTVLVLCKYATVC